MADEESAKPTQPCVGAFDDPAALIAAEFSAIFVVPELVIFEVMER
jgi:hypothetical protein